METDEQVDHPILGPIVRDILHRVDPKLSPNETLFPLTRLPVIGVPTPVPIPNLTRLYFKFGKPVDTAAENVDLNSEEACQALYDGVRNTVNVQLQELQELRAQDDQVSVASRLQRTMSNFLPVWEQGRRSDPWRYESKSGALSLDGMRASYNDSESIVNTCALSLDELKVKVM
eukprot:gene21422-28386_t